MKFYNQDWQDQSNELDEMINNLQSVIDDISSDNPYRDYILETIVDAEKEKEEIDKKLQEQANEELEYQELEYRRSVCVGN